MSGNALSQPGHALSDPVQETAPTEPRHPLTLRAAVIGIASVVFLSVAAPFTDLFLQNSELSGNHLPLGPMLVLIALIVIVNGALQLLETPLGLSRQELLFVFCMTLVAAGIPTFGLVGYLLPAVASPMYFASPENDYASLIQHHIPSWLIPSSPEAVRQLYEGARWFPTWQLLSSHTVTER
ncbi:MAG: hypothetical protein GW893_18045 [Armatimonadetes bacterium]|nr:hypothetical protein [Armatimonadota bacterium]PIY38783.1 MAG: hypothetical protein COZ05_20245 [Armatimonadetes bacterium CG_4_10_14_3_um_filter_59_10]